ncbi:nucleoside transporter [Gilliamella sp. wkB108]|uniref:nucleoside permease n=1 Tax=Gilliamella sp. wkB108 TaxID=3120256 RepID=UPI00080EE01F|nr:nucleoside permease [Gilliamella apicola]OCG26117.1 nucleoside transporter [Gilliamella apicola]
MNKTNIKLSSMMFLEWFIWGAWFVPLWQFLSLHNFSASQIGLCYASTAIAAIFSPIIVGSITDRYFAAQKVLSVLCLVGALFMYIAAQQTTFTLFFPLLLLYTLTYMPTIALTNTIAFSNVSDVERYFPRIRVLGTIGWIASGVACGFLPSWLGFGDISASNIPLIITALSSALLGIFALCLPNTPPKSTGKISLKVILGLDAIILLKDKNFRTFAFCSFLFCIPLAFYYTFSNGYLSEIGMKNATGWLSLGQVSEILFMLCLPLFMKRYGIKNVLLLGLTTAAIRYGFFIYGGIDNYFIYSLLFIGILLHGVSYDFYFVTAYVYVDKKAPPQIRTAAQGLITLCCQGFGSLVGYNLGGTMMEYFFKYDTPQNGLTFNWGGMWGFGAIMIVIITLIFLLFFREKRDIEPIKINDE